MAKYIVANCTTADQAQNSVNDLLREGFPQDSITLVTADPNQPWAQSAGVVVENGMEHIHGDDESLWQRIKEFFGVEEQYNDMMNAYRDDIQNGNILVVVNDAMLTDEQRDMVSSRDIGYWGSYETADAATDRELVKEENRAERKGEYLDGDDDTLRLEEERLNVDKEDVEAGEVVLKKRVVEENQTINVPLRHEEVVIERTPVNETRAAADGDFAEDTITIPIWEEQARVTKEPVITEEVHVRKSDVENTRQFSANVRKEMLDVEKEGNVVLNDGQNPTPPAT